MTHQLKPVNWTDIPVTEQRRMIALLGRLTYRHMVTPTEEMSDES